VSLLLILIWDLRSTCSNRSILKLPLSLRIASVDGRGQGNLKKADWVFGLRRPAQVDIWRPNRQVLTRIKSLRNSDGIDDVFKRYKGTLVTETMLVEGVNDHEACICKIASSCR
jgi:hypothetical protein